MTFRASCSQLIEATRTLRKSSCRWSTKSCAVQKLAQEKPGQSLQATAIVHEASLRMVDTDAAQPWNSVGHIFAAAAEAMSRILVENARLWKAEKYGGGWQRHEFLDAEPDVDSTSDDLLTIR
jgi:ECF sigma factor